MPVKTRSQTKALISLKSINEREENTLHLLHLLKSTYRVINIILKQDEWATEMNRLLNILSKNKEGSPINSREREMCFDILRLVMEKLCLETLYYEYLFELFKKDSTGFLYEIKKKAKQHKNVIYDRHIFFKDVCHSIKKRFIPKSQSEKKTFAACVSLIKEFNEKTLKSGLKNNEPINNEFLTQDEYDSLMSDYRVVVKSPNHIVFEYDD